MLTPVFHPNIAPHAICIGDHWSAGEALASIVVRIGEMLAYQSYNTKSPLNGEAARWVALNEDRLPLDPVSMMPEDNGAPADPPSPPAATPAEMPRDLAPPPAAPATVQTAPTDDKIVTRCPACSTTLRVQRSALGKQARCPRCREVFAVTEQVGAP